MNKCERCHRPIEPGREYLHLTHKLCESCYMQRRAGARRPRSPWDRSQGQHIILKGWLQ